MLKLTLLGCLLGLSLCLYAQDANYWTNNYNAGGFVSPGAVVAWNRDSGVLFYNPALLAYSHKNTASISGTLYQYEHIRIKNGIGTGLDLNSTSVSVVPQLISGVISLKGKRSLSLAYALLRDPVMGYQVTQRKDQKMNALDDSYSPGSEYFIGQYSEQNSIVNTTALISAGFKLNDAWAVGISMEGLLHKQNYMINYSVRAIENSGNDTLLPPIASVSNYYLLSYLSVGLRFKAGVAYNSGQHHFGLMATLPQLHLGGHATLLADNEVNNLRYLGSPLGELNLLANTRQTGLPDRYKTPFSVALGYAFDYNKEGQVYLSAEYFGKIKQYSVVKPRNDYFLRPDTGSNNANTSELLQFDDARRAVLNLGIGVSFLLKDAVMGYCAFHTDVTSIDKALYNDETGSAKASTSAWNIYHLQLGANFRKRKFNLRPSLLLSYGGTNQYNQPLNFDNAKDTNLLLGDSHTTHASRLAVGVMFAYLHNL